MITADTRIADDFAGQSLNGSGMSAGTIPVFEKLRLADTGDSTTALGHGTRFSSIDAEFAGRSDDPGHTAGDVGTLKIYQNGTAKWKAQGDTYGSLYTVGTGLIWMESGTAGKGFGFVIDADDVSGSAVGGTDYTINVLGGTISGFIGFDCGSMPVWSQFLNGFQQEITGIIGYPGRTTFDVLANIDNVFSVDSHGKPLDAPPNVVHVSCGINDCTALAAGGAGYTIDDVLDNLTAIKDAILARGACVIFSTLSHETPGTKRPYMDDVNDHIDTLAAASPSCVYVADYKSVIDDAGSPTKAALPDMMIGPHYTPRDGCRTAAPILVTLLQSLIPAAPAGRSDFIGARPSLVTNGDFISNGGTLSAGAGSTCTGVSAWDVYAANGTGVDIGDCGIVCSKEASTNEYHPWQVYTVTGGAADSFVLIKTSLTSVPEFLQAQLEYYLSNGANFGCDVVADPTIYVQFYDNMAAPIDMTAGSRMRFGGTVAAATGAVTGVIKTDVITAPTGAVTADLIIYWGQKAGHNVVVKFRNAGAVAVDY